MQKGVSPVAEVGVVLMAHRTSGSFSAHRPFALSSFFFSSFLIILFAAST
ncbi:hypothetical protein RchiOBHm_Chr1g0324751 [Rosa chinensis]|uniref:Uncharacterized protein n=1 Tax=Rosa chinensis TaxID=74649 RepID=A0A2P6S9V3_ROSCH|nr:hypothetical protein RchiOBHm_Chr1g0324751 [Rosa chinensis]